MHAARTPRSLPSLAPRQADQEVRAAPTRPAGCCPVGGGRPQTGASRRVPRREARPLAPSQALLLVPSQSLRNPRLRLCFRISDSSEQPASSAPRKTVPRETGTLPTDSSETPRSRLTGPQGNSHAGHAAVALFFRLLYENYALPIDSHVFRFEFNRECRRPEAKLVPQDEHQRAAVCTAPCRWYGVPNKITLPRPLPHGSCCLSLR